MAKRSWIWKLLAAIGLMFASITVFAATVDSSVYVDVPNDYSLKYLNMLFGNVGNTLNGSLTGQTVGHLFYLFNQGVLIASGIWVLLALIRILGKLIDGNVQEVSKEGKTFLSICLGVILIIPSPSTGYSTIQGIIMKVVVQGVELANGIWEYQIENFRNHVHVFDNPPQQLAWANTDYAQGNLYTYSSIMQTQVAGVGLGNASSSQVDKLFYKILQLEVLYYQSQISCQAQGDCDTSSTLPSMIASSSTLNSVDIYPSYTGVKPVTVTAKITGASYNGISYTTDASDCSSSNPKCSYYRTDLFSSNLKLAAQALSPIAKSFACQSDTTNSTLCAGVSSVNLDTAANTIIGLLTSTATAVTNAYSLMILQSDTTIDGYSIDSNTKTCKARWLQEGEVVATYDADAMTTYKDQLEVYYAMQTVVGQSQADLNGNTTYQQYSTGKYAEDYQSVCTGDVIQCHEANHQYMSVGEVGAWGSVAGAVESANNVQTNSDEDVAARLAYCEDWIKNGHTEAVGYNSGGPLVGADAALYLGQSDGTAVSMSLADPSLAWMNQDLSDSQITWLCENYGSILYQVWNDRLNYGDTDGRHGLDYSDEVALLKLIPDPTQFETVNGYDPLSGKPVPPEANDLTDEQAAYSNTIDTCTNVLANSMERSGWIMAGSYYWLIAHQDQEMVTTAGEDSNDFLSWSSGKKMYEALGHFTFTDTSSSNDNLISTDKLAETVSNTVKKQFIDTGTNIGQIDTMDTSSKGIAAQLAWAGNAFNAVISGESDSISSYKNMQSVDKQFEDSGENSSQANIGATASKSTGKSLFGGMYSIQSSLFPQLRNQVFYLESFILNIAEQLNNPNLDPQSLLTNIGIGMIYQGGYATLGYFHMMISLMIAVVSVVVIMACVIAVPIAGIIVAAAGTAALTMMVTFVKIMGGILKKIGTSFAVMGAVLAFYVPLYPWVVFTFAAIGWFIAVIEAMAAGPLVCLNMTNPQSHELLGSIKQAIMLLLSIFIRPALMILSFITAMILARVALSFMIQGFLTLLGTIFNNNATDYCQYIFNTTTDASLKAVCDGGKATSLNLWNTMFNLSQHAADIGDAQYKDTINAALASASAYDSQDTLSQYVPDNYKVSSVLDGRPGPSDYQGVFQFYIMMLSMPILLGMLTYMTYEIINNAYSLVYTIPDNVQKWIGGQAAGDSSSVKQSIGGAKQATEKAGQSAGKGLSESTKAGEASGSSIGKGVAAGVQKGTGVAQDQFGKGSPD